MADFLVEWHCQADASGRVTLPKQCRQWLQDGCVVEYWPEQGCVSGWPISEEPGRKFSGTVHHLYIDARGRLTIPEVLRKQASITGAVVVFAVWFYFEIWSEEGWQSFLKHWKTDEHPFLGDWPEPPKWVDSILDEHLGS